MARETPSEVDAPEIGNNSGPGVAGEMRVASLDSLGAALHVRVVGSF